ncbi:MAG: tetratricopeptide repeat protein [Candidatus Omnitrophica bacterium]|nr:tetratricopeptide repeat protein [Candidatus Omnitrophota bacterium]
MQQAKEKHFPHYLVAPLLIVLGFLVYFNSLKGVFVFDDRALIIDNPFIKDFSYIKDIFTTHLFKGSGIYSNFYRPIQSLSFMIDYRIWGLNPLGYRLTSILIHSLNAVFVYFLVYLIFKKQSIALITSLLFCVHTVLSWPVNYIASRADLLLPFFFLAAILLYVLYKEGNRHGFLLYVSSILCFILSIMSKEIGLMLPLLLLFYNHCFPGEWKKTKDKKPPNLILPFLIIAGIYMYIRATLLNFSGGQFLETTTGQLPLYIRMLTTSKVLMIYIRLLLFPLGLHMEWDIQPASSFFEDEVFLSVVALCIIAVFTYFLSRTSKAKFFAIGWFFITLLPSSNIIPLNYFMGEAWLYIPSIGFLSLIAMYLSELIKKSKPWSVTVICGLFLVITWYSFLTIKRTDVWGNPVKLYTEVLKYSPDNTKARINLGTVLAEAGSYDDALQRYNEAAGLLPKDSGVHSSLGSVYADKKMYDVALKEFKKAVELNPKDHVAHNNIGIIYRQKGDSKKAMEEYTKALELQHAYPLTYNNIGNIYLELGQYDAAIRVYKKAISLDPNKALFYGNLGKAYKSKGMIQEARESFEKALRVDPNHNDAVEGLNSLN